MTLRCVHNTMCENSLPVLIDSRPNVCFFPPLQSVSVLWDKFPVKRSPCEHLCLSSGLGQVLQIVAGDTPTVPKKPWLFFIATWHRIMKKRIRIPWAAWNICILGQPLETPTVKWRSSLSVMPAYYFSCPVGPLDHRIYSPEKNKGALPLLKWLFWEFMFGSVF